jgi:HSP20 family protein
MDIFADDDDLVIRCELAGVTREDVDLTLDHDALTIFGERTGAPNEADTTFYVRERHFGAFRRTINLPEGIKRSSISASLAPGLLASGGGAAPPPHEPERIDIDITGRSGS